MTNTELVYEDLDYDLAIIEEIRNLRSGYSACGFNRIYRILNASKPYAVTVPFSKPVNERLYHDIVRAILITNLLSELFTYGDTLKLSVYDGLEDVKEDAICLCEEYIDYFSHKPKVCKSHQTCIELFTHIVESLASETHIDILKTFELLGI
jgi:hypothetical protein